MDLKQLEILRSDLKFIDRRLAVIETTLTRVKPGEYQTQELQSEAATLAAHRRAVDLKIREITGRNPDHERVLRNLERVEILRAARVANYRNSCLETAEQFERQGDYRNASLWRLESLNARKVAEHEIT